MEDLNAKHHVFVVSPEEADVRLDRWMQRHLPHLTQGKIQKGLRQGDIRVNGAKSKTTARLRPGQEISVFKKLLLSPSSSSEPPAPKPPSPRTRQQAARLHQAILYQDQDILVLNKPPGLATQGGTGLAQHVDQLLALATAAKPYLVHRLDRQTSGVLLVALNPQAAAFLGEAFRSRKVTKTYWALVAGTPPHPQGEVSKPLQKRPGRQGEKMEIVEEEAGKEALTQYRVLQAASDGTWSWLELIPYTGRTHQLRVHCAALGCPIIGDGKYGGKAAFPFGRLPLHLHARSLSFPHPKSGTFQTIDAPLPPHMEATWKNLLSIVDFS